MQLTKQQRIYILLYLLERQGTMNKSEIDDRLDKLGFGTSHTEQYTTMARNNFITSTYTGHTITDDGREQLHLLFMRMFPLIIEVLSATDIAN